MPEEQLKRFYIVKEHPVRIISKCKSHSKGTLTSFLIGFCVLYMLINWVPSVLSLFFPATNADLFSMYTDIDKDLLRQLPATSMTVFLYSLLFSGVFKLSECLYTLTYIRNRKIDYAALTEGFSYYFKALGVYLLQIIIISFWTMLFVIPGIIAALNFSQAFYILAEDPEKGVTEVLAESKIMMYGNKMNYFRLLITYIPYLMLGYTPAFIVSELILKTNPSQPAILIAQMVTDIPIFIVLGLMSMGKTVFYELMLNKGFADFRYAGQDAFREMEDRQQ